MTKQLVQPGRLVLPRRLEAAEVAAAVVTHLSVEQAGMEGLVAVVLGALVGRPQGATLNWQLQYLPPSVSSLRLSVGHGTSSVYFLPETESPSAEVAAK